MSQRCFMTSSNTNYSNIEGTQQNHEKLEALRNRKHPSSPPLHPGAVASVQHQSPIPQNCRSWVVMWSTRPCLKKLKLKLEHYSVQWYKGLFVDFLSFTNSLQCESHLQGSSPLRFEENRIPLWKLQDLHMFSPYYLKTLQEMLWPTASFPSSPS